MFLTGERDKCREAGGTDPVQSPHVPEGRWGLGQEQVELRVTERTGRTSLLTISAALSRWAISLEIHGINKGHPYSGISSFLGLPGPNQLSGSLNQPPPPRETIKNPRAGTQLSLGKVPQHTRYSANRARVRDRAEEPTKGSVHALLRLTEGH